MVLQLLPCPSCERVTALTAEVSATSKVRCPHCGGEFLYSTFFREPQVQWEVVDGEPARETTVGTIGESAEATNSRTLHMTDPSAQTLVDTMGEYEGLELELEPPDPRSDNGLDIAQERADSQLGLTDDGIDRDFLSGTKERISETNEVKKKADWSSFQPLTPESYERQKLRKRRSPVWPILQVVLGGVMAIPIALLLVWHLIGTDVGDAGPWVGKYVPWIVPEKFRPYQSLTPTLPPNGPLQRQSLGSGLPTVAAVTVDNAVAEIDAGDQPPQTLTSNVDGFPADSELPQIRPASVDAAVSGQAPNSVELNPPLLENTFALIRQAAEHLDDWSVAMHAGDVDLKSLAPATYRDLTNLALVIERLPPENLVLRTVRKQLGSLGRLVVEKPEVQRLVVDGAKYWVKKHTHPSTSLVAEEAMEGYGLAMIIVVEKAEEVVDANGTWWRVVASDASSLGDPPLELRIPRDVALSLPGDQFVSKQLLFLLGVARSRAEVAGSNGETLESKAYTAPRPQAFTASYVIGL